MKTKIKEVLKGCVRYSMFDDGTIVKDLMFDYCPDETCVNIWKEVNE